jgi:hypothetical protein
MALSVFILNFQAVEMAKRRQKVNYLVQVNKTNHIQYSSVAESELRAEEPKLNCLPERIKYRIAAPALSIYHRLEEIS